MAKDNLIRIGNAASDTGQASALTSPVDPRQKALAIGLEFTKRCFEAKNLDELYLLLTNDIRALVEFDRSSLLTHIGGVSRFVAAGAQPIIETKSKFHDVMSKLAPQLKLLRKGVLISGKKGALDQDVPESVKNALNEYVAFCQCDYLFCVPFIHDDMTIGHLLLEFLEDKVPDQVGILTVLNISPFVAAALCDKWLREEKPELLALADPLAPRLSKIEIMLKHWQALAGGVLALIIVIFLIPFPFSVGGEAEIVPTDRHVAFCTIEGLIEQVMVAEGAEVQKGQVLATLDPKELEYKIKAAEKQFEIFTREMTLLRNSAGEDPSKLADSQLVDLKRTATWEEIQYLKWQQQFLEIKAPVAGIILTKDIESVAGKKLRAGEPFCEIAVPGKLSVDVFIPDDRITYVKKEQELTLHLSGNPRKGYDLKVKEIAPAAEAFPRLGNVYRVRALFPHSSPATLVGMKGVGKVHTGNASLWFIVTDRLFSRWQQWSLHF